MNRYELPAEYREAQLKLLVSSLESAVYPGYPERDERLVSTVAALGRTALGRLIIPDGPWNTKMPIAFRNDTLAPSELTSDNLAHAGHELDSDGRPLHPWFERMVEDPKLGVVTGRGKYWSWGPNLTADSVVVHDKSLLLIRRGDTGDWALPGGFIDGGEHAAVAAKREVREETGVDLAANLGIPFYKGPVVDPRMTAHAWPETTAYLFSVQADQPRPDPVAHDDATHATWVPFEALSDIQLFGSHRFLADLALSQLCTVQSRLLADLPADVR